MKRGQLHPGQDGGSDGQGGTALYFEAVAQAALADDATAAAANQRRARKLRQQQAGQAHKRFSVVRGRKHQQQLRRLTGELGT